MATSKQIRAYAREHNMSNAEARAHFINEASNDNMSNAALRAHYGISSAEAQQIVDVDNMLNNVDNDQDTHNKVDVRFKICNQPGICAFSVFEPETTLTASTELLEMCMRQYKTAHNVGKTNGAEPFVGKHAELINRLGYVMQVILNSQSQMFNGDEQTSETMQMIMSAALVFIRHSIKEYLGVEAGHIEMIAPGVDPSHVHKYADTMDDLMVVMTKGYTSWLIKDTEGNVVDIDCDFADLDWDTQITGMQRAGLLKESHRRPVAS